MHYKNGRPANIGDMVIWRDYNGLPFGAIVIKQSSSGDTCNLSGVSTGSGQSVTLTAKDCVHIEDAFDPKPYDTFRHSVAGPVETPPATPAS